MIGVPREKEGRKRGVFEAMLERYIGGMHGSNKQHP
jgi:hypothetical protein